MVALRQHLSAADPRWLAEQGRVDDVATAARTDPRIRYLPHAVALGVAHGWAEQVGPTGRVPDWYVPASRNATVWPARLVFSSSSNPALAPSASAGAGGSTYVGGGAGGGGGGSW